MREVRVRTGEELVKELKGNEEAGLVIRAPRSVGKTKAVLEMVLEEPRGYVVVVDGPRMQGYAEALAYAVVVEKQNKRGWSAEVVRKKFKEGMKRVVAVGVELDGRGVKGEGRVLLDIGQKVYDWKGEFWAAVV